MMMFHTWRKVLLGTHSSAEAYAADLEARGVVLSYLVRNNVGEIPVHSGTAEVELVCVTPGDLGFRVRTSRHQVVQRGLKRGLERCPRETALALRGQYLDQPNGEALLVVSKPLTTPEGDGVFSVAHLADIRLAINTDFHDALDAKLLFARRKPI